MKDLSRNVSLYCDVCGNDQFSTLDVQKLYTETGGYHEILPYNLYSTVKSTLKMENGIKQTIKFLSNSRLPEKSAKILSDKMQLQLI